MNGTCNDTFFLRPQPLRPWGAKRSILLNLNFRDFRNQTLCVFSHMKDIKNVRWDFPGFLGHSPGFWTWGAGCCQKFNFMTMGMWHIK